MEFQIIQAGLSYLNQDTRYGILTIPELFGVYNHIRIRWTYQAGSWYKISYPSYCLTRQPKFKSDFFSLFFHSIDHVVSLLSNFTYTDYIEKLLPFFFNIVTNRLFELKKEGNEAIWKQNKTLLDATKRFCVYRNMTYKK